MTGLGVPAVRSQMPRPRQPAGGRPPAASESDLAAIRDALPRLSLAQLLEIKAEGERRYRELQSISVVVDAREVSVTCAIRGWAAVARKRQALRSQTFSDGEHDWRLLVRPCGAGVYYSDNVSVYLEVPDAHSLPKGWSRKAGVTFTVKGRGRRPDIVLSKKLRFFNAGSTRRGFRETVPKGRVDGYVKDDTLTIQVRVTQEAGGL